MAGGTGRWILCALTGWLGGYASSNQGCPGVARAWRMHRLPRLYPAVVPETESAEPAS